MQQQRLLARRAKAREDSSGSTRSRLIRGAEAGRAEAAAAAGAAAAPPSAAAAEEAEESEPVQSGAMLAVVGGEGGDFAELALFSSEKLGRAWRDCCGVRGEKMPREPPTLT